MPHKAISDRLNRLADGLRENRLGESASLAKAIFIELIKLAYAQVRSQAPAAILRRLIDLEMAIGGEDCDFNRFDGPQMLELLVQGDLIAYWGKSAPSVQMFLAATEFQMLWRWIMAATDGEIPANRSMLRYFHAWLQLFGETLGLLDIGDDNLRPQALDHRSGKTSNAALPTRGEPYVESTTGMTFVFIPGGEYSMGDTFDDGIEDEKPVHTVRVSDFFMGICPVTQAQWRCLMTDNPSSFIGDDHPVEQVTFSDVTAFIEKLNSTAPGGVRFDLPSEAEWEYAARSGGKDELYAGGQDPEAVAWLDADGTGRSAPVKRKKPNGLGLYDMSGNVWEWCRDIYQPDAYRHHAGVDPVCTATGRDRVIRGGAWHLDAWSARCARRFRFDPELFGPALGFRLVMRLFLGRDDIQVADFIK